MISIPLDLRTAIDLDDFLSRIEVDVEKRKGVELYALCPHDDHNDSKPSWSINNDKNDSNFGKHNCWSCGFRGNVISLWRYFKNIGDKEALVELREIYVDGRDIDLDEATLSQRERDDSEEYELKFTEMDMEFELLTKDGQPDQWNYLLSRGVTDGQIKEHRIGYHTAAAKNYARWIVFPVFFGGDTVGWRAKNPFGRGPEMASDNFPLARCFWNWDSLDHDEDEVVIVEGILDALRVEALGYVESYRGHSNLVACMTNRIFMARAQLLREFKRVIVIADGDDGGKELEASVQDVLGSRATCFKVELPSGTDPNDTPKKFLRAGLMRPKPIVSEKFLVDYSVRG